ncbi:MAG: YARHG domain-containing protein [Lachnospiraceae bacterium]|nr:YARHG domain-containing protein [Lachnospiraceae bacterium]
MKCVKCGSELKPGARFCSKCGAVISPAGQQAPGKIRPAEKRPAPVSGGSPNGGNRMQPRPDGEKKKGPAALAAVLAVLLVCVCLSVGGIAAYMLGAFDAFLPSSDSEVTQDFEDEKEEDKREEKEEEEDQPESGEGLSTGEETETESENGLSENSSLPTEAVTEPVTAATIAQPTTGAMPTLAGQGASYGLPTQAPTQAAVSNMPASGYQDYILPESSIRLLSISDLAGLSKEQLRIARNEIYARHGRMFATEELQQYFNSKSWYRGTISASSFSESMLSQLEKDNIKLIQEREDALP